VRHDNEYRSSAIADVSEDRNEGVGLLSRDDLRHSKQRVVLAYDPGPQTFPFPAFFKILILF